MAIAPPLMFSFSSGMFSSRWARRTTEENASLISQTSMSSGVRPALARAARAAGAGAVSMIVGSTPVVAAATTRARGVRPFF